MDRMANRNQADAGIEPDLGGAMVDIHDDVDVVGKKLAERLKLLHGVPQRFAVAHGVAENAEILQGDAAADFKAKEAIVVLVLNRDPKPAELLAWNALLRIAQFFWGKVAARQQQVPVIAGLHGFSDDQERGGSPNRESMGGHCCGETINDVN